MADEKETKLEITDKPKAIKDIQNTLNYVCPKVAKIGQDMGKDFAKALRNGLENMGYEFREVEIQKSETLEPQKQNEQIPPITHTPEYIIKLIDAGKITNDYRVITTLNDCAAFLHDILPVTKRDGVENKNISLVTLQQLRKKDGTNFDPKTIEQAITYGNSK